LDGWIEEHYLRRCSEAYAELVDPTKTTIDDLLDMAREALMTAELVDPTKTTINNMLDMARKALATATATATATAPESDVEWSRILLSHYIRQRRAQAGHPLFSLGIV
jgi:hypothetical protein